MEKIDQIQQAGFFGCKQLPVANIFQKRILIEKHEIVKVPSLKESGSGVEGWGENADNCNRTTIKYV